METEKETEKNETKNPTPREKIAAEAEQTRQRLVNLQAKAYELKKQLEGIEAEIVPATAAYQTAMNVLKQTEAETK